MSLCILVLAILVLTISLFFCGNFDDSLSPEATYSSAVDGNMWRLLLVLVILLRWSAVGIDVSEAFTQSDEKNTSGKKTFARLPSQWKNILMPPLLREKGITEANWNKWVFEIVGWLYGERGAPKAWRATLLKFLLSLKDLKTGAFHFRVSTYDADILFTTTPQGVVIVILFVDDLWIFAQVPADAIRLLKLIRDRFKCTEPEWLCGDGVSPGWCVAKSLSGAPTFCAISVYFEAFEGEVYLVFSQVEFIEGAVRKLVEKEVLSEEDLSRPVKSLDGKIFAADYLNEDCEKNPALRPEELTKLRAAVNTLSYAALRTKTELLPALGQCARGQSASGRQRHLTSMIVLIRYAYGTRFRTVNLKTGIRTEGRSLDQIPAEGRVKDVSGLVIQQTAHFDASLGCSGSSQDAYARQGAHFFLSLANSELGLWLSKCSLQSTISLSTTEAELTSATSCAKELVGTQGFLQEMFPHSVVPTARMWGDNQAANSIGNCLAALRKVRHLSLAQLWVRKATADSRVSIDYVKSAENMSDMLTKILPREVLDKLLRMLGIFVLSTTSQEDE